MGVKVFLNIFFNLQDSEVFLKIKNVIHSSYSYKKLFKNYILHSENHVLSTLTQLSNLTILSLRSGVRNNGFRAMKVIVIITSFIIRLHWRKKICNSQSMRFSAPSIWTLQLSS